MCAFGGRGKKKLGANVTSLFVYQNSLNTTTKEGETRTTLYFDGALFPKENFSLFRVHFFRPKRVYPLRKKKKNYIFTISCPQTIFLLRMFVCVGVCFDIVLLDFGNLQNTTKEQKRKKKLISCHARVRLLVLIFPRFKAHTPTTIMYCAAVRSLFPLPD